LTAREQGREFRAVNERRKVQITDASHFPPPIRRLHELLASPGFLQQVEAITGIDALEADPDLFGGGMHMTGPAGRLDVHVDFNFYEERQLHRRLNILVYLNDTWPEEWGGAIELWDAAVSRLQQSFTPRLNRCVLFETSDISYHGVSPVTCPPDRVRKSFAAYYYTRSAPAGWDGTMHDTVFRARPTERLRGGVLMPAEKLRRELSRRFIDMKQTLKSYLGR
jgi:hypothetical protein